MFGGEYMNSISNHFKSFILLFLESATSFVSLFPLLDEDLQIDDHTDESHTDYHEYGEPKPN